MKKLYVKIEGMHCQSCETKVIRALSKIPNVSQVIIKNNIAHIEYQNTISTSEIIKVVTNIGYITNENYISENLNDLNKNIKILEFLIILIFILTFTFMINRAFGFNVFNMIPKIDSNATLGMLFVIGLMTSIHCISMCGAINLISSTGIKTNFKRPLLYNVGRLISYTIVGGIVGFIGRVISINYHFMGIIILLASIIMLLMGLNMMGLINFKLPQLKHFKIKLINPFVIGLLNGLMPCGPLQAMQLYALTTGSFISGALSMFVFALGTIPLMLLMGIGANLLNGNNKVLINKISATLVIVLSITMLNRGLVSLNINLFDLNKNDNYQVAQLYDDYQVVEIDLTYDNYQNIIIKKDIPVKFIINVDSKYLTGCNNEIHINEFGIKKELVVGQNIVEFIPNKVGTFVYSCWMNMIVNHIKVVEDYSLKGGNYN